MELYPEIYWHLADRSSLIFHNAYLGKGFLSTISLLATGDLAGATTPYAHLNHEQDKEQLFEAIRTADYPNCPTRIKSFYCFASKADADRAKAEWYHGQEKELVEVQIVKPSVFHRADSKLLDGGRDAWEKNAHLYWKGATTNDPLLETIVHGMVFFPGWERSPFGLLGL